MAVRVTLSIKQNSQNITNNTSNVTVNVTASWTYGSYNATGQCTGSITIDGTKYSFSGLKFNTSASTSGSEVIMTKTVNVNHNSDGTKTLSCSTSFVTGVSSGTVSASGSKVLTTIPRKSSISVSNGTLGSSQTISVTRQSTSFTHSIRAVCGSSTVYIASDGSYQSSETKHNVCSISFIPPLNWARQNTTGTTVSVQFIITTYNGSTNIGTNSKTVTMTIPASITPTCSVEVTDPTGIKDIYGKFVKGLSKFKVVVTPVLSYGSEISSYKTTANGNTYTSASFTTSFLSSSGTLTITSKITDKRGRSDSTSVTNTVLDYNPPLLTDLSVHRCDSDGSDNEQGEYINVQFTSSVTSLDNRNTANYSLRYKKSSETNYTTTDLSSYNNIYSVENASVILAADSGSSYDVELTISDSYNSTIRATTASTGFVLMHWNTEGNGMGIGKMSELENVCDIGMQTRFYGGILHPVLEPETDLNDIRTPNIYVSDNASNYNYSNCPLKSGTFTLEVVGMGESGQVKQRITYCHKTASRSWERIYYSSSWGEWICVSDFDGQLLWEGGYYMNDTQTITLYEPISKQRMGILLVFCRYSNGIVQDYHFSYHFVPKLIVAAHSGCGSVFHMGAVNGDYFASKYLYIHDQTITGNEYNDDVITDANNGITYTNNATVLRYVIGI